MVDSPQKIDFEDISCLITEYLYSSYCNKLRYDECRHIFVPSIPTLSNDLLFDIKKHLLKNLGCEISVERIYPKVFSDIKNLVSLNSVEMKISSDILVKDVLVGEVVKCKKVGQGYMNLMKFSEKQWIVLEVRDDNETLLTNNTSNFKPMGVSIETKQEKLKGCFDADTVLAFMCPNNYHIVFDKHSDVKLYNYKVTDSLSNVYRNLWSAYMKNEVEKSFDNLYSDFAHNGFGIFVMLQLLNMMVRLDGRRNTKDN